MKAEVLYIDECMNWPLVGQDLRHALDVTGNEDVPIAFTLISSPAQAAALPFAGSPTILIDGADLFPGTDPISELACRLYPTADRLQGRPARDQIERAILARGDAMEPFPKVSQST